MENYIKIAKSLKKTNPDMKDIVALKYAAFYNLNGFLKLPIIYNPPENMYDITSSTDESRNPSIRYYVKGRER